MTFTVEEISLLLSMNHSDRRCALQELKDHLALTVDEELRCMYRQLEGKLCACSDKDFEAIDFDAWKEDLNVERLE